MRIERTDDDQYPYVIKDAWDGRAYADRQDLEYLIEEIQEMLDKDKQK